MPIIVIGVTMADKTTIQIDKDIKNILDSMGSKNESYNDIIKRLIEKGKSANTEDFKTAKVGSSGTASISRTLAGCTIEYRVKK